MAVGAELFDGPAEPGSGGGRSWWLGVGGGAVVPGQRLLHLQGAGPAQRHRGDRGPPQRNWQTLKLAAHHAAIRAEVVGRPDATLDELRAWLLATHRVKASLGLMHKTLARLGLTLKKSRGGRKSTAGTCR